MRFVRCEACGAKALVAASQCPKCGHLLALRDDDGNTVPLDRCRVCDCYYPRSRGPCRWCVSQQPPSRVPALLLGGGAAMLLAGVTWGGWQVFGDGEQPTPRAPVATAALVAAAPESLSVRSPGTQAPAAGPRATVESAGTVSVGGRASSPSPAPAAPRGRPVDAVIMPPRVSQASPPPVSPSTSAATTSAQAIGPPPGDSALPAVILVGDEGIARTWINVRSGTNMASEVVGVIQPNTRVAFGESRRSWVRVRTDRLEGWADRRLFGAAR